MKPIGRRPDRRQHSVERTLVEGSSRPPSPGGNGENGRSHRRGCERPFRFETEVVCFYWRNSLENSQPSSFIFLLVQCWRSSNSTGSMTAKRRPTRPPYTAPHRRPLA